MKIKKLRYLAVIGLLLPFAVSSLAAATYYVDSKKGDDSKDGLSEANAWKSLSKINALTLKGGDKAMLKRGSVFSENLILKKVAGTAEASVVIEAYGAGKKPKIHPTSPGGIQITNCKYLEIRNLELHDGGMVLKTQGKSGTFQHIVLDNLYIHDIFKGKIGINISEEKGTTFNDITIKNCRIERTASLGIRTEGVNDLSILDNTFKHIGGPGIVPRRGQNLIIRGNVIDSSGSFVDPRMTGRGSCAWIMGCKDVLVEHNTFMNAQGRLDCCGFHIDINNQNVVIQYNLSIGNAGGFAQILGLNRNCTYRYNISINDGWREKKKKSANGDKNTANGRVFHISGFRVDPHAFEGPYNSYIYNNTIYVKPEITSCFEIRNTVDGILIANNIFHLLGKSQNDTDKPKSREPKKGKIKRAFFKNNLYFKHENLPEDMNIKDTKMLIGDAGFANSGGLSPEDYIPGDRDVVVDKGIIIEKLKGDKQGLKAGLKVTKDFLGNPITGLPDLGAIEVQ